MDEKSSKEIPIPDHIMETLKEFGLILAGVFLSGEFISHRLVAEIKKNSIQLIFYGKTPENYERLLWLEDDLETDLAIALLSWKDAFPSGCRYGTLQAEYTKDGLQSVAVIPQRVWQAKAWEPGF